MQNRSLGVRPGWMGELNIAGAGRRFQLAEGPVPLTGIEHRLTAGLTVNAHRVMPHGCLPQRVRRPDHAGPGSSAGWTADTRQ